MKKEVIGKINTKELLHKAYDGARPSFRPGVFMTEKDRPRKKIPKQSYEDFYEDIYEEEDDDCPLGCL